MNTGTPSNCTELVCKRVNLQHTAPPGSPTTRVDNLQVLRPDMVRDRSRFKRKTEVLLRCLDVLSLQPLPARMWEHLVFR